MLGNVGWPLYMLATFVQIRWRNEGFYYLCFKMLEYHEGQKEMNLHMFMHICINFAHVKYSILIKFWEKLRLKGSHHFSGH